MFSPDYSLFKKGVTVGVGYSGGVDSSALLHDLAAKSEKLGITVVAINVEHGIRGEASVADSLFCEEQCKNLGVPFFGYEVDCLSFADKNGYSLEQAARILRYECFFKALSDGVCDVVALAHHMSDNAETVLFNVLRGSSATGGTGMKKASYGGKIIRPFLYVSKAEILDYAKENNIPFVEDETNADFDYTRNALRLKVIPEIKKLFPEAERAITRFAETLNSDDEYLYSLAEKSFKKENDKYFLPLETAYPVFSRAVVIILKELGVEKDYQKSHVDAVYALKNNIGGKEVTLPKGVVAVKEGENAVLYKRAELPIIKEREPFKLGKTVFKDLEIIAEKVSEKEIEKIKPEAGGALYFDLDKLPKGCVLRTRETGDEYTKFGGGTVSLKKYLTDLKVPKRLKDETVVLAKEKIVYCVLEKDISMLIKIDKNTKNIVKLYTRHVRNND